jgi:diguanylate cyclase (GGDEF)-like protein
MALAIKKNSNNTPKILVVDDIPVNIQLMQAHLASMDCETIVANNGEEALTQVDAGKPDLILLDVMMPKMDGFEACRLLKSNDTTNFIPIIMVTALNDIEDKVKGIEAGADDFITKPFNKLELLARVKSLLRIKSLHDELQEKVTQLEVAKERLNELAITDGLTGLYNYRHFREVLAKEIRRAKRHENAMSIIMLDIDFFKHYNDTHGHLAGDEVLRTIAKLMIQNVRSIDIAARYGGEEFALVLPETNHSAARVVADKIKALVEEHEFDHEATQPTGKLTVSMGIATFPENGTLGDDLIQCADERLYKAKAEGRNLVIGEE